jgi:hypothetical protein
MDLIVMSHGWADAGGERVFAIPPGVLASPPNPLKLAHDP